MLDPEFRQKLYEDMVRMRILDERTIELRQAGKIPGGLHSGIGEEATFIGACAALRADDYMLPTHRGIGHVMAKGIPMNKILADCYGKESGTNQGKGGIIRICDPELGVLGISGTLGGVFVIATGAGLSIKYLGEDKVCLAFFGDGTSNRGTFHESLNMCALWNLPVVFVCNNNQYGMYTHISRAVATGDIVKRAHAYGIPSCSVDGNDVEGVYLAVSEAVEKARAGEGPFFVEAKTYRWRGHHEGDPGVYRTHEEIELWKTKCPIQRMQKSLLHDGILSQEKDDEIWNSAREEVEDAVEFAENSDFPSIDRLYEGLWV
jgi:TPP-dependent pyruvate/acetoin dehydrogenase alpha subunit